MADDEILRLHAPLIVNRRVTIRPVEPSGRHLDAGARVKVIGVSADRDEVIFGDPDDFRLDRNPADSLLCGRGIHVCPGAPLAPLELERSSRSRRRCTATGALAGSGFASGEAGSIRPTPRRRPSG